VVCQQRACSVPARCSEFGEQEQIMVKQQEFVDVGTAVAELRVAWSAENAQDTP